jgi:predicted ATPase/DNA-binding winged helix-turn-helix (wHTH) protein
MNQECECCFGRFRLDPPNARLLNGRQSVALKPKAFDVLVHLVRNAGRLVSQDELLREIWPGTIVGDSSLKSCIRQIRKALGDRVRQPQFIETVHRRGYRFIAPVTAGETAAPVSAERVRPADVRPAPILVGRDSELRQLDIWLDRARGGERQVVFVVGGPGTGKTALVEAFLRRAADPEVWVASGQCFEQFGSGEAYLPMLEAIGRLSRDPRFQPHLPVLSARAPTWLAQLPGLPAAPPVEAPLTLAPPVPPERLLREMAEALEELTAKTTLIIVLEDLQWADYSTLDLLSALARRRQPARLLVIANYRPAEAVLSAHPLRTVKHELQSRGLAHELPVELLTQTAVADYLEARFPGSGLADRLARRLHQRTEGHPLFLVDLLNDWLVQGVLIRRADAGWELRAEPGAPGVSVPASIRALVKGQLERHSPQELRVLEGAAVAGVDFTAAAAAAAVDENLVSVEECCEGLARRHQFLRRKGTAEWLDGTVSARYRFGHELYHRAVSERVTGARRRLMHQRLGERLEAAYAANAGEVAAELALHFEQGRDPERAARYLELAGNRAARNYAHREAIDYFRRALAVVERLPAAERAATELRLHVNLGLQLQTTKGFGAPDAKRHYARARELCRASGDDSLLFPVLWGLWLCCKVRSELSTARTMAQELLALGEQRQDSALVLQAQQALAVTTLCLGEPLATREHMRSGAALYDPQRHRGHSFMFGQDPGVACRAFGAVALWLLGYPDQALQTSREATRLSHELLQPSSQALALHFAAMLHQCRREGRPTLACAELALAIGAELGLSFWRAGGTVMRGWAVAECGETTEGVALLRQGLDAWQATGSVTYRTYYLALLAEMLGRDGRAAEGLELVNEALALVEKTSERLFEPELHRLRGEMLLATRPARRAKAALAEAESCFCSALDVARGQQSKSLELRAVMSLARLSREHGRPAKAKSLLAKTLGWFTEGFDTADLKDAQALLKEFAGQNDRQI